MGADLAAAVVHHAVRLPALPPQREQRQPQHGAAAFHLEPTIPRQPHVPLDPGILPLDDVQRAQLVPRVQAIEVLADDPIPENHGRSVSSDPVALGVGCGGAGRGRTAGGGRSRRA